jgi:hypothetical protein
MHPIDARVAKARFAHEQMLAEKNDAISAEHPSASFATQFVLTESVWNGRHSHLLLSDLRMTPYDPWNIRLVAADDASASALGLPRVYLGEIDRFVEAANRWIDELLVKHGYKAPSRGRNDVLDDPVLREIGGSVAGIANYLWEEHILPGLRNNS